MVENILLVDDASGLSLELDTINTPYYILDNIDWGQVPGEFQTYKYVNQAGSSVENVNLGVRNDININGWIIADTENQMTARKQFLNLFVNPQHVYTIFYKTYKLKFYPNSSIKYTSTKKDNNNVIVKFKIEGRAYNPLFFDKDDTVRDGYELQGMFHFPLIINSNPQDPPQILFGWNKQVDYINIINSGQVSTGFKIIFKARGGNVLNPSITNGNTLEFIKINKQFIRGEEIEINTIEGERAVRGKLDGVNYNYYKYRDINSSWMQLAVGDNLISYSADSGVENLDIFIRYNNKYLEVQQCY